MFRFIQRHTYLLIFPILSVLVPGIIWSQEPDVRQVPAIELTVWVDSLKTPDNQRHFMIPVIDISPWEATRASISLVRNEGGAIPFRQLSTQAFYVLTVGEMLPTFVQHLRYYVPVEVQAVAQLQQARFDAIPRESQIIVALNQSLLNDYALRNFLHHLSQRGTATVVNFSSTDLLGSLLEAPALLQIGDTSRLSQSIAAQALFGGMAINGGLPASVMNTLQLDTVYASPAFRLGYAAPEYVGISSDSLQKIEAIAREAIASYAMPGCQVLIAHKGQVIYHEAFGFHTYEKKRPVLKDDLYDLASITKIAATTLATMKLYEDGELQLNDRLGKYFQDRSYFANGYKVYDTLSQEVFAVQKARWMADSVQTERDTVRYADSLYLVGRWVREARIRRQSRVFDIPLRELLTHTSGLQASLPIYAYQHREDNNLFHFASDRQYSVPVAENLYMNQTWLDSLWNLTKALPLADTTRYRYSCVNMILLQRVIDSLYQDGGMQQYLKTQFYQKLGLQTMGYNPLQQFAPSRLIPTSADPWRDQVLCGTVHDPTAALLGGVSGNAGLFSNANDLAILAQMWLNGGEYGGERFFQDSTVQRFTMRQKGHRGYGFDKPPRDANYYVAPSASLETYGHTGFTGTCVWVDPEHELVYVFLSNRVHPNEKNYKLNELRVRRRIHQVIYDQLGIPMRRPPLRHIPDPVIVIAENEEEGTPAATLSAP